MALEKKKNFRQDTVPFFIFYFFRILSFTSLSVFKVKVDSKIFFFLCHSCLLGFLCSSVGKESACNAGDPGSVPGSGRCLEKEVAIYSSIPAWRIPWMEEPGGVQSMGSQKSDTT